MLIRQKTIAGVVWHSLEQLGRRTIQIVTTLILAWFLLPEDFGLVAIATVFFTIANALMDSGLRQALIRKRHVNLADYCTAFYANISLGLFSYCLLFLCAPFIAVLYEEEQITTIVRVVGLVVIINSFHLVQLADLSRKLDFKTQMKAALPSALVSAFVAILMAAHGYGVWSLVAQMITAALLNVILLWVGNRWRPRLIFSTSSFREMFSFGSKLFVAGILDIVFKNVYLVIIAKLFSTAIVGYYFLAGKIQEQVTSQLTSVIQKVTYPALATMQDEKERLKAGYRKVIQMVSYVVFPVLVAIAVLADALFELLLKEVWWPAIPYLQLLCIAGLAVPLYSVNLNIMKVLGRTDLLLKIEISKNLMMVVVLSIAVQFGIFGILAGQILASMLAYAAISLFSGKLINYSMSEQFNDVIPNLILALVFGASIYFLAGIIPFSGLARVVFVTLSAAVLYVGIANAIKLPAQLEINSIARHFVKKITFVH